MRSFTFTEGTGNKFWNIDLQGKQFTVTFGKVGTNGQTQVKAFADAAAAKKEHDKLVAEKVKKGYVEESAAPAPAAPPPAPVEKVAPPPPAPASPAPGNRTFEFSDASSHKFWNIERAGVGLTITYGRIGAAGQTQLKTFADEAKAVKEFDKLVAEKTGKGYRETTPSAKAQPKGLGEALVMALVENPDDLASHMAYADYLEEQGDPRGELIRIGLALEDPTRSPAERKKLQAQEKKLIAKHEATFFGEVLSLIEPKDDGERDPELKCEYTLRRGWIDSLKLDYYLVEDMRLVARSPELRLLRTLDLGQPGYEEDYQGGDDIPPGVSHPQLYPLARATNLGNVRVFLLGDAEAREGMDDIRYGTSCHTAGDGVLGVIKQMPKVEEIHLYAHRVDTTQLFGLKTLDHLRVLRVYHNDNYPLAILAKNPSLGKLTHFLTHPHAMDDEHPYIRTPAVKALVNSTTLPALTHLQLRLSDTGDKGVKEIVASGILGRLKVLDLQHGCVSDKGAEMIAKCPDAKKLERLDLTDNALTPPGVAALETAGVKVQAAHQWQMQPGETLEDWIGDGETFLFAGDIE